MSYMTWRLAVYSFLVHFLSTCGVPERLCGTYEFRHYWRRRLRKSEALSIAVFIGVGYMAVGHRASSLACSTNELLMR